MVSRQRFLQLRRKEREMSKLKPCPFCGGEAKFFTKIFSQKGISRDWQFGIYCTRCDVTTPRTDYKIEISFESNGEIKTTIDEREIAAEAWNRRSDNEQR